MKVIVTLLAIIVLCSVVLFFSVRSIDSGEDTAKATEDTIMETPSPFPTSTPTPTPEPRVIYITFDDGPYMYTERLLDILDEYDVKATFFVTGNYSDYTYLIGEEYDRGHAIGIHAYNHDLNTVYDDYLTDFHKMQDLIYDETGEEVKIFRFPGGSSNTIAKDKIPELIQELTDDSYIFFDWDVDSCDATTAKTKEEVLTNLQEGVLSSKKYSVCLCHDVYDYTVDAIEEFIPWALGNGFVFDKLTTQSPEVHHYLGDTSQ